MRAEGGDAVLALAAIRAENGAVGTAIPTFRTDRCAVLTLAACLTVRAAVLTQAAFRTEDTTGTVQAGIAIQTQIGTILADIGTERTHACTVRTAAADVTVSKAVRTVGTFATVGAYLSALVAAAAFLADIVGAGGTAVSAFIKALGAVLASIALLAELKAVRALSAAGTACRTHTVGAEMAVRANLIPAVEAVLAAVLADGRTGGTAIAADTGRRTAAAFVAVAAPGFVVAVAALTDSAVGAKGVIAVAAMLAAVRADRCAILAAVAADTGVHAAAAGAAVVAPAVRPPRIACSCRSKRRDRHSSPRNAQRISDTPDRTLRRSSHRYR